MHASCRQLPGPSLERAYLTFNSRHFRSKRCFNPGGFAVSKCDSPDVGSAGLGKAEFAGNPAVHAIEEAEAVELCVDHLPFISHNVAADSPKNYSCVNQCQGESVPEPKKLRDMTLGERIKHAREEVLKLNQAQFSSRLGVSQSNVSKWESGRLKPETDYLMRLASLLGGNTESLYFLEAAGVPSAFFLGSAKYAENVLPSEFLQGSHALGTILQIPLLRDAAPGGTPRAIEERDVETYVPCPRRWAPRGAALIAFRVTGDSMAPLMRDGSIVVIDTSQRDPKKLVGRMVAARNRDGVTIKWLRRDGDTYLLVPEYTSPRYPVHILREEDGWSIAGVVIHWIAFPPGGSRGTAL